MTKYILHINGIPVRHCLLVKSPVLGKTFFYVMASGCLYSLIYITTHSHPPASEASREVANLTERKNPHTPVYSVKEFVCLIVISGQCE